MKIIKKMQINQQKTKINENVKKQRKYQKEKEQSK